MRNHLSVDREANAIRLRRSTFSGAFLLVEGKSDKVFYERFVDRAACSLVSISGKPSSKIRVVEVLETLERSSFQGILAIVDADFEHLETSLCIRPNLIRTDTHDLETMLLKSPALDKVIAELGSEEKITGFGRDIRIALLEAGASVGYLLWVSQIGKLNLTFDGIAFSKFIDEKTLEIDELKLIQEVKNKSQNFALNSTDLQLQIMNQKNSTYDLWQVCRGHDLVEILSLGLRRAIGSAKATDVEPNSLERYLRIAYEDAYFLKTQVYSDICTWEHSNHPFKVLVSEQSK